MQSTDKKQAFGPLFTKVWAFLPAHGRAKKRNGIYRMGIGISNRLWYNEPYPEIAARYNKIKEIKAP